MKANQKTPQEVLALMILDIGSLSEGWGVDILISAIEYLDSDSPEHYLQQKSYMIAGVRMAHSSVHMWDKGHPRTLPKDGHGQPVIQ